MIPRDYITEWRAEAPWVQDSQVEQDLIISKALVEIFSHPLLGDALAFRGGTALYKLYLRPAARYSESWGQVLNLEFRGEWGQVLNLEFWDEPWFELATRRLNENSRFKP